MGWSGVEWGGVGWSEVEWGGVGGEDKKLKRKMINWEERSKIKVKKKMKKDKVK